MGFYARVGEFSKVLIERRHRRVFGRSGRGQQAVHEMDLCLSIAFQRVEVNRHSADLDTRAGNEPAERRRDVSTWLLIERVQYKHTLGQNSWQKYNHHVAAVAGVEQLSLALDIR